MIQLRILGSVNRDEFFGRDAELRQIVRQASGIEGPRALVVAAQPDAGASELLRQAYDQLFARRGDPVPIYFAFRHGDDSDNVARRFCQTFLQQFVAYRRVDPSLCNAQLAFNDLLELALPGDYEFLSGLVQSLEREQSSPRNLSLTSLSLPHRFAAAGRSIFPLIDCLELPPFQEECAIGHELIVTLERARQPFALAGLRRQVSNLIHGFDKGENSGHAVIHTDRLADDDAAQIVEALARRYSIDTNDATRDLVVQQLNASPVLISALLESAREKKSGLASFRACQQLYVDELMGGVIKRYFDRIIELACVDAQARRTLFRLLYESAFSESNKMSLWAWKKRLGFAATEFERTIDVLHTSELVNSSGASIEVNTQWQVWLDYLRIQYQLEVKSQPRAQIVVSTLLEALKRAPQTMARKYRREASLGLGDLVSRFDCQPVPATLFHYDRFAEVYRGEDADVIVKGLDNETELIQLPQIVQVAACSAYDAKLACDAERCVVAHGFEGAQYADENETVWLCAQIDSKLEAGRELADDWCDRLSSFARECGFKRFRIWLVAPEGFSERASESLNERGAFLSSRQQVELLKSRIAIDGKRDAKPADEFEMVIPMGADTELIAARTAEQIARRVNFRPEAINQIKTAVVEACINAAEHSLSPDRKIYQRFVVEDDRLVITVASRGVVPMQIGGNVEANDQSNGNGRRGWGLKLIRSLMDEVEFERVDDGTQLKMTKYRK
jgi:serine/threonine-protein kinase RsbW